jgi:uncharacterized protein YfaP (DUF2135 family)
MTRTIYSAGRILGVVTATLGGVLLLVGCASAAEVEVDQSVVVTYVDGGESVEVEVDIPRVECSELAGTLSFTSDDDDDRTDGRLLLASATDDAERQSHVFSVALGDGLWFTANNKFSANETGLSLDTVEGIVSPVEFDSAGTSDYGTAIDTAATVSGALECTTTD